MRIPIIKATEELPRIPVTATTEGAGRAAQAVGQLSGLARDIALDLAQKQQGIKRARQVAQAEIAMEAANRDIVAKLRLEPNHETYFEDWLNEFEFASTDMLINAKGPKTKAEMEQALNRIAIRESRIQKDYANQLWLETEQTEVAKALQGYATEGRYDDGIKLIDSVEALYGPKELLALKGKFKTSYDAIQKELADVKADQAIMRNPNQALIDLQNKNYLPDLEPMQRQDKIEKAKAAAKILENEQKAKLKEAEKKAHDEQEKAIGEAYKNKDYHKAWELLKKQGNLLTGDEDRIWSNAIREVAEKPGKTRWDYTDPEIESDIISRLGKMEDDEIRAYMGNGLSIDDTLKYLDKNRALDEDTKKLQTPQYKEAQSFLKLAKDRAIFLPDVDNEDDLTDEEALENRTLYTDALKELERQVLAPENKKTESEIANEIMKPYFEKKSVGWWQKFISWVGGGQKVEKPTEEPIEPDDPKRQQAIDLLKSNNKLVNEETIKQVMDQL